MNLGTDYYITTGPMLAGTLASGSSNYRVHTLVYMPDSVMAWGMLASVRVDKASKALALDVCDFAFDGEGISDQVVAFLEAVSKQYRGTVMVCSSYSAPLEFAQSLGKLYDSGSDEVKDALASMEIYLEAEVEGSDGQKTNSLRVAGSGMQYIKYELVAKATKLTLNIKAR